VRTVAARIDKDCFTPVVDFKAAMKLVLCRPLFECGVKVFGEELIERDQSRERCGRILTTDRAGSIHSVNL